MTEEEFCNNMLQVAENIQNLYNSMESTMPQNSLSMETSPPNAEDIENDDNDMDNVNSSLRRDLQHILMAGEREKLLEEEASVLNPQFTSEIFAKECKTPMEDFAMHQMHSIVEVASDPESCLNEETISSPDIPRFHTTVSELNTLAMQHICFSTEQQNQHTENDPIVIANGKWESIVLWGVNAGLDDDQQTAFEILTATYVLTFYDEATVNVENMDMFEEQKQQLQLLARCNKRNALTEKNSLRMFLTGPAGAGKCKLLFSFFLH